MSKISVFVPVVAVLTSAVAHADDGEALRGHAFAQQLCAGCHAIEKGQTSSPLGAAPPFASLVARSETWNGESFADWLGTLHPVINGVVVKPGVAADLLAYIRSLAGPKQQAALDR